MARHAALFLNTEYALFSGLGYLAGGNGMAGGMRGCFLMALKVLDIGVVVYGRHKLF
jgi:hypothetical protein